MTEISRLLAALTVADRSAYPAGALSGWPGFAPWRDEQRAGAVDVWRLAAPHLTLTGGPDGRELVLYWIRTYLSLDIIAFTPAYVLAIYLLLRKIWDILGKDAPLSEAWIQGLALGVLVFDWSETGCTWFLVGDLSSQPSVRWAHTVAAFSCLKWFTLAVIALFGLLGLARILQNSLAAWLGRRAGGTMSTRWVWTRHRNQLGVLLVLGLLVVMPGGGPLEQLPDIERAWAHNRMGRKLIGDVLGPVVTLFGLCLALWVAGRWALLHGVPTKRKPQGKRSLICLLVLGLVLGGAAVFLFRWGYGTLGALAIPIIVVVLAVWSLCLPQAWREPASEETQFPPADERKRVRSIGRALAVVPLAIAGLGLTRAYARPYFLGSNIAANTEKASFVGGYPQVVAWFWFGVATAVLAGPVVYELIRFAEERWLDRPKMPLQAGWHDRRRWVPALLGGVLLLAAVSMGVKLALDPLGWGPRLRSLGVLVLVLATVTLIAGWLARHAEYRLPLPALRYLHFRLTPIWLLVVGALVLEAQLDTVGGYHEVRLRPREASAGPPAKSFNAAAHFDAWFTGVKSCMDGDAKLREATAVPMVFVAAPGGGIRAAYWTGSAMDELTKSPCAQDMVFGASGVSGGSLGLVGYTLGPKAGQPIERQGREFVESLMREDTLAANLAAMFYRDLPRALHGINNLGSIRPGDRAAVFERSWERIDPRLKKDLLSDARLPDGRSPRRPLLLLNGTDVSSGCRVVVSSVLAAGGPLKDADPALNCQRAEVAALPGGSHKVVDPSRFAAAAIDAAAYTDKLGCKEKEQNQGLRLSTAVHLAARFPYISPSGRMHHCITPPQAPHTLKMPPQTLADLDGGLLESSGLALLLELWEKLEPQVAAHNKAVANGGDGRLVLPLIAVLDNHYQSLGAAPRAQRQTELLAPLIASKAPKAALSATALGQVALYRFSGALPGTTVPPKIHVGDLECPQVRSFFVAPSDRPGIAAPLGWVLSAMSKNDLDEQLKELVKAEGGACQAADSAAQDSPRGETPATFSTLLKLLEGPVTAVAR
ncbi:hypothetical protein [Streptomyces sp. NPDC058612]|uniref:hypothetical protein n=1 Tax=Streptomyces sp. NPDC058612 TaxID=3346555 RepID=UPI003659487D